ncbi:MAG: hypothetical protein ABI550_01975 [Ignavibacteriaceae bacterium]
MDDFSKKIENLKVPEVNNVNPGNELKKTILNAKKSAAIGIWFIVIPAFFLFCVFMKYYFKADLHIFDVIEEFFASLDHNPATKILTPILFVGLPIAGIIINFLAILHFDFDKTKNELNINLKLKFINISLIVISGIILGIFFLYAVGEYFHHLYFGVS